MKPAALGFIPFSGFDMGVALEQQIEPPFSSPQGWAGTVASLTSLVAVQGFQP